MHTENVEKPEELQKCADSITVDKLDKFCVTIRSFTFLEPGSLVVPSQELH